MENDDEISAIRGMIQSEMLGVNTCLPGVVVSYEGGLATVRPVGSKQYQDGESMPFPNVFRVPVRWPTFNGGQCGMKGPIMPGDEVLLVFSQQATDGSDDLRRFDLSDAYAVPCSNNQASGGSNNEDTILYHGAASIRLTADGKIIFTAPAGTFFDAPSNDYNGTQTTQGLITGLNGLGISGGVGGSTVTVTGNINTIGSITNNGKVIDSTHTHSGVDPGPGSTGPVN